MVQQKQRMAHASATSQHRSRQRCCIIAPKRAVGDPLYCSAETHRGGCTMVAPRAAKKASTQHQRHHGKAPLHLHGSTVDARRSSIAAPAALHYSSGGAPLQRRRSSNDTDGAPLQPRRSSNDPNSAPLRPWRSSDDPPLQPRAHSLQRRR